MIFNNSRCCSLGVEEFNISVTHLLEYSLTCISNMRFQILHIMIVNRVYYTHHVYKYIYIGTVPSMKYNVSCTCMLVSLQIYPNFTKEPVMSHVLVGFHWLPGWCWFAVSHRCQKGQRPGGHEATIRFGWKVFCKSSDP